MLYSLVLLPFCAGIAALLLHGDRWRRALLVSVAAGHLALTLSAWIHRPPAALAGWLGLDAPGLIFLTLASILFLASMIYALGYLSHEKQHNDAPTRDFVEGGFFTNAPEAILSACLLFFLSTMSLVCISQHLGLFWVAIESTTLASAPLIYFHRHRRSLAAAWKYLLICSIGIALALLGNFLLAAATMNASGEETPLLLNALIARAPAMNPLWLKASFLFLLIGYGTKMGLAPLHTWLPDAHSESPSIVSALLSGALLNCAFLGILRAHQICSAAGLAAFTQDLLILFGLLSMGFAAVFILYQTDFKRMLAYSSVEHMGILALGVGLSKAGAFGAMFHAVNHSLTKGMLFLVAGNILAAYKTKSTTEVRALGRRLPLSSILWLAGFFAITGTPPFGTFLSEFTILKSAIDQNRIGVAIAYLALLAIIFMAMLTIVMRMAQGSEASAISSSPSHAGNWRESVLSIAPPAVLGLLVFCAGIYMPPVVASTLHEAARLLGGQ